MGDLDGVSPTTKSGVVGVDLFLDLDGEVVLVPMGGCKVVGVPVGGVAGILVGGIFPMGNRELPSSELGCELPSAG